MQRFPLLGLPHLALKNTLQCLTPIELFTLAQCSKKLIDQIKFAGTANFKLSIDFSKCFITVNDKYHFRIHENDSDKFKKKAYRKFGYDEKNIATAIALQHEDFLINHEYYLISSWYNRLVGFRTVCFHLSEVFGCKIDEFESGYNLSAATLRSFVEEIVEKQDEIPKLIIKTSDFTDSDLKWVLDTIKVVKSLSINVKTSDDFKYNFKQLPKTLEIHQATCFTLDNLLLLNSCAVIVLGASTFTNKDLEKFINVWKAGRYPKLEYLEVGSTHLDDTKRISGLTQMWSTQATRKTKRINHKDYEIIGGVDIQRDDRIMGTIRLQYYRLELLVWN